MTTPSKPRVIGLTLNDDGRPTHICLFEREEGRLQLELVDKSDYDSLATQVKEKDAEIARLKLIIAGHHDDCNYIAAPGYCNKCGTFSNEEALAKGDGIG